MVDFMMLDTLCHRPYWLSAVEIVKLPPPLPPPTIPIKSLLPTLVQIHPLDMAPHPNPATTQLAVNAPSILTTCSLPLTASLNFCTKGIRVWFFSFQKLAMCVRVNSSMMVFATLADINIDGDSVVMSARGVMKDTSN
jgi:hypothetical protein